MKGGPEEGRKEGRGGEREVLYIQHSIYRGASLAVPWALLGIADFVWQP